jgi:hypothetical protein
MSTESEIKIARYKQVEKEADAFGRVIGVRRLRPSEQSKVIGMTPDLSGGEITDLINDDGQPVIMSHRGPLFVAAAVCDIDDKHLPFPKNRAESDWAYDNLDIEGINAAIKAIARLSQTNVSTAEEIKDEAKN